jgi:serine protease Do
MFRIALSVAFVLVLALPAAAQNPRDKKVLDDRKKVEAAGYWIYNDLPKAFDEAKKSGKPMVVIFRCIPCVECVKLDDDLVDTNRVLRPLLDRYVRARVVSTNGLDLSLFAYDYDQSFACFLLNADGTIYGRFGTRSHRTNWVGDVSIEGLAKALEAGLALHAGYPKNKSSLAAKRGPAPAFPTPEKFPMLRDRYGPKLDYKAPTVSRTCIHCHQIGDAIKNYHREKKEPLPDTVLFPYPHPKAQGLILDPREKTKVLKVEPGSPAEKTGFRAGDDIRAMNGQPLLSIADVQWVLHWTPGTGGTIKVELVRDGRKQELTWVLAKGWRQRDDLSWRSSSWGLRRMATGGMRLEEIAPGDRPAGTTKDGMALLVKHVGQYGPHAAAKNAGFRVGDVIVSFDGKTDLTRETDVLAHALTARKPGERVKVKLVRKGKMLELMLPMQG